jgi:hypothetical protein
MWARFRSHFDSTATRRFRFAGVSGRKRAVALALLTLACALFGIASAAGSASSGAPFYAPLHGLVVPDASVNGNGVTFDALACPKSHPNATGGGAVISGDQSHLDLELKTSFPSGRDWAFELNNSSGSAALGTTLLICAKGDFKYPTRNVAIPPGGQGERFVTCPKGTTLAGGGVNAFHGDHKTEIASSAPEGHGATPNAWDATVNNGSAEAVSATVGAVCAKRGTYKVVRTSPMPLPDHSQVTALANCPKHSHVSSGGVRITGLDNGLEIADSTAFDNGDGNAKPDNGWQGTANNDNSGSSQTMQTFAICKKK